MQDHYALIRSYGDELLTSNPGSTVKIGVTNDPDEKVYFDRFYVCLNGLKEGWKNGCRRVIALDGCFLKRPNQGELLTAIADLEIQGGVGVTLMSDQHKGLIEAVKDIMPYAEHRQCARHIYENFRKQFSGVEFRNMFWEASKSSYPILFDSTMENIKDANPNAYKHLSDRNLKSWVIIMERMNVMRRLGEEWVGDIAPNIQKRLEKIKDQHRFWKAHFAGGFEYEVSHKNEAFKVDEQNRTCSCRMWQLSGIPCQHACYVIFALNKFAEEYIPDWFRKEMYMRAFSTYLKQVGGMSSWVQNQLNKHLPPKPKVMPGRPQKKRRRAAHETGSGSRISKAGAVITCFNCLEVGHNKKRLQESS
ncbi:uncharacterized protein [Rutidosis leptorrhynchoides]|uniref:uncharacterized protein n=1 Tax=Rutidosis leptorrhynchoides TaxID=125765 RepID=UPI003A99AB6A